MTETSIRENEAHLRFYNCIRSCEKKEFEDEVLQPECSDHSSNTETLHKLENVLSKSYEELKLKNVPLTREMELAVESKLVELRYFCERNKETTQELRFSLEDVQRRVQVLCEWVRYLERMYSDNDIDDEFLLVGRLIAQNIRFLKRQLRSTYKKLPWEEIEFCLVIFLSSVVKQTKDYSIYKLILDKQGILFHLSSFVNKLSELNLENKDIDSKQFKRLAGRALMIEAIVSESPQFKDLYADFKLVKNIYSLNRIQYYVNVTLSMDLERDIEVGKLTIQRTLQVIGECLQNTPDSPNLSDDVHKKLIQSAPVNLRAIITSLRHCLSHPFKLPKKVELESGKDVEFFRNIQNDLKKIHLEAGNILFEFRIMSIKRIISKILNSNNLKDIKCYGRCFRAVDSGTDFVVHTHTTMEFDLIQELVSGFKSKVLCKTPKILSLFNNIEEMLKSWKMNLANIEGLSNVKLLSATINYTKDINMIHKLARISMNSFISGRSTYSIDISDAIFKIIREEELSLKYYEARMKSEHVANLTSIFHEIYCFIEFGQKRIKGIDDFKRDLEEINDEKENTGQEKLKNIIAIVERKLESEEDRKILRREVEMMESSHHARTALIVFLKKKLLQEGTDLHNTFDTLMEKFLVSEDNKKNLRKYYAENNFKKCKELVEKAGDSYGNIIKSLPDLNLFTFKKSMGAFLQFSKLFGSMKKTVENVCNQLLKENEDEIRFYYKQRLILLKEILQNDNDTPGVLAALEMLVLDLSEILEQFSLFGDNKLFFEAPAPILIGKNLRNYLAHGDSLIDVLPYNPATALLITATVLLAQGEDLINRNVLIGRGSVRSERIGEILAIVRQQKEMFSASKEGDIESLAKSVENGADVKGRDFKNWTGLHFAAMEDNVEVFDALLKGGVDIKDKDINEQTCHLVASSYGSLNTVKLLPVEDCEMLTFRDIDDKTMLHLSAENGHYKVVEALLAKGAGVDVPWKNGLTALHLAALAGHDEVMSVLLKYNAKVNAKTEDGFTPLHFSARNAHENIFQSLLQKGASLEDLAPDSMSVLHLAAFSCSKEFVLKIIELGVDVESRDRHGMTALHFAARFGNTDATLALLTSGAKLGALDSKGRTPLHYASQTNSKEVVQILLEHGADVNAQDEDRLTPLSLAILSDRSNSLVGRDDVVEILLASGADVNLCDFGGLTALHYASRNGHKDLISLLVDKGAIVDISDHDETTPLHEAALEGHNEVVQELLRFRPDVNAVDRTKSTPLHRAVVRANKNVVLTLLNSGADVDPPGAEGATPLHLAVVHGESEIVAVLLEKGASVKAANEGNLTALHLAIAKGYEIICKLLLEKGSDVNAKTEDKHTPLNVAALKGHLDIVKLLLIWNADMEEADKNGLRPLHSAALNKQDDIVRLLLLNGAEIEATCLTNLTALHLASSHKEVTQTLLKEGASVEARTSDQKTPLHYAAEDGNVDVVKLLLERGARVDALSDIDVTPLHDASRYGHTEVSELLLSRGAKVDAQTKTGWSPLHWASQQGHLTTVNTLLRYNANVNLGGGQGVSALHLAAQSGKMDVTLALLNKGADPNSLSEKRQTSLHSTVQNGHIDIAELLLSRGTTIDFPDSRNQTALHTAVQFHRVKCVRFLLNNGASVLSKSDRGTVLHAAIGSVEELAILIIDRITRQFNGDLSLMSPHINAQDIDGNTPFMLAMKLGKYEVGERLLECGAKLDVRNYKNQTVFEVAAEKGSCGPESLNKVLGNTRSDILQNNVGKYVLDLPLD